MALSKIETGSLNFTPATKDGTKNLIINGAKVIDQRNAGASVSGDGQFPVDRWKASKAGAGAFSMQQSSTAPSGFSHSVVCTVTTAATSIAASDEYSYRHFVEAFNFSHANWGTSSAYSVTLSFWVRSSVTGTYAVGFRNHAGNRTNPSTYTISSANTWEYKTITVAGDTTGTWEGASNLSGVGVIFSLGAGSNFQGTANTWNASGTWSTASATQWISNSGATFYITGVQLEIGETATPFEHRSFGDELARCQRYFCKSYDYNIAPGASASLDNLKGAAAVSGGTAGVSRPFWFAGSFPVKMRIAPTITLYHYDGTSGQITGASFAAFSGTVANVGERGFNVYRSSGSTTADADHYCIFAANAEL
jgi:hypothetical protein